MKKEIVEERIQALANSWAAANAAALQAAGRPGPTFCMVHLDDRDYVEECWTAHHAAVEADVASAVENFWVALSVTPLWLRNNPAWLEDAWKRAFVHARHGWYVGHSSMPFIEEVFERACSAICMHEVSKKQTALRFHSLKNSKRGDRT